MQAAHTASGAEMVTVAVNRVPLDRATESFLDYLAPEMQILPNTAGCYDAEHAIRTAQLAREALETDWIKLEVIGDKVTLCPTTNRRSKPRAFSSKKVLSCCRISPTI